AGMGRRAAWRTSAGRHAGRRRAPAGEAQPMGRLLMRKINGKVFLGLLLGTLVLSGTVFAVHHFQRGRIARALLWQARRAEEQGQTQRMTRYLQRYLEFNPADREEKARLARAWAGEAFSGSARQR